MPGSAREEAERLVATVLAMADNKPSSGTRESVTSGLGALGDLVGRMAGAAIGAGDGPSERSEQHEYRKGWATGSAECCVCPVCKAIAAVRDPSPQTAVRLASGAGDLAIGVATVMRAVSSMAGETRPRAKPAKPAPRNDNPDQTWQTATRNQPGNAWSAATNRTPAPAAGGAADEARTAAGETGSGRGESGSGRGETGSGRRDMTNTTTVGEVSVGGDSWAAATTDSAAQAAVVEAERRAAAEKKRAEERAAAKLRAQAAAAEAARRVEEAAAQARAARAAGGPDAAGGVSARSGAGAGTENTSAGAGGSGRTPRRLDVWAAATADAGVGDVERAPTVDHDVPGAEASGDRDGARGDDARDDRAV